MKTPYLNSDIIEELSEPFAEKIKNRIDCTGTFYVTAAYHNCSSYLDCYCFVNDAYIITWCFNFIPGNDEIAFSTNTVVNPKYRRLGVASIAQEWKFEVAKEIGIKKLFCTVNSKNEAQLRIMAKHGWTSSDWYTNSNNQIVKLFSKEVK